MKRPRARTHSLLALALVIAQAAPAFGQSTGTATPATAGKTAAKVPAKADTPVRSACNRDAFRVIVDVGHTAEAPGAKSARGVYEYEFNLRLAS